MSDEGEKTCPLCAEEMDLTDQQLKPCKCGYEICVWCWHHIMNMAEKDETEGRCPACRTPYNKEKIVGMAAKCERMVAEINMDKKGKSHKTKSKISEGRKQLSSVRVIQRNLVYVVGLPLNLADEDLLQRKEYFGQYGKVLKVSISRTAAGAIQHFANSTCSVYITYSKEDEAVRCIQSIHGFTLEGRSLRACFGTTKYCHAWLRSMPCSNPDCLYLHEIGLQEDSFTKDEIISAYTRVQQITGATNDMQRRSGTMLPPPADEYCNNGPTSSGNPTNKIPANNPVSGVRVSPPPSSSGRPVALPAAASWGMRASNSQPPPASLPCSNGPSKEKPDICSGSLAFSTAVANPTQVSIQRTDVGKKLNEESRPTQQKGKIETLGSVKQCVAVDHRGTAPNTPFKDQDKSITMPTSITSSIGTSVRASCPEKDMNIAAEGKIPNLCSDMSLVSIDRQGLQITVSEQFKEPNKDIGDTRGPSELRSDLQTQVAEVGVHEVEEDLLSFDDQRLKDPEVSSHFLPKLSQPFHLPNDSRVYSPHKAYGSSTSVNVEPQVVDKKLDKTLLSHASSIPVISNGYHEDMVSGSSHWENGFHHSYLLTNEVKNNVAVDMGESSIISNILSMDSESWNQSLTSPQNIAKLLGPKNDKQQVPLKGSNSWKAQNSNQSRFSFAREEESINQVSDFEQSLSSIGQAHMNRPFSRDFVNNRDFYGNGNGFSSVGIEELDNFASSHPNISSNKLTGSRSHISAPPGFSVPNRAPPPGFSSHERLEQTFDNTLPGNHMLDSSSLRKQYQAPPAFNSGGTTGDIEFMDPAILAVGKGRLASTLNTTSLDIRSNFPQLNTFENDARLQLLMQRSLSPHQSQRYAEMGDSFSQRTDAYGLPSRMIDQNLTSNLSPYSHLTRNGVLPNGHWDGWSEVQSGNDLGMAELLRNERLGLNKYYGGGYEDSNYRMSGSGDLYNRPYGI
ncbi:hypothetical protein LguiB_031281 [Lonicera macranthoides]